MASVIKNTTRIDSLLLMRLSRMYEQGISIKEISEELEIEQSIIKKLLKLLGYTPAK
jgi:DNA-binding MarR family transcriptional regulator